MSFFAAEGMLTAFPLGRRTRGHRGRSRPGPGRSSAASASLGGPAGDIRCPTPGGVLSDPIWNVCYRVHCRQAERYQAGRVFLVGDAAHVCSNIGGQGMNAGMQDAYNLGWKLGLVLSGRSPASLPTVTHPERHQAGQAML